MSIIPDSPPPKPPHDNQERPPLDLDNVIRQVNLIQEQLKRQREKKCCKELAIALAFVAILKPLMT